MVWGPLGVSAGYRYSPSQCRWTQGCTMAEGDGREARGRGALHDAQGTAIESLTKRSTGAASFRPR